MTDLSPIPFVKARHSKAVPERKIRLLVVHTCEILEKGDTAELIAAFFSKGSKQVSAHYCVDADSVVQCVKDHDVAYAAPGGNHDGLQFELAGFAAQNSLQWADAYSNKMLDRLAVLLRAKAAEHNIPLVYLNDAGVRAGKSGITTHAVISRVYKKSNHTDPGPWFPMGELIRRCGENVPIEAPKPVPKPQGDDMTAEEHDWLGRVHHELVNPESSLQRRLAALEAAALASAKVVAAAKPTAAVKKA